MCVLLCIYTRQYTPVYCKKNVFKKEKKEKKVTRFLHKL